MCVTLNEGYLRSANRGSNNLYRFFGLSFLLFFLDERSTNLLRLFSGNLPAMFCKFFARPFCAFLLEHSSVIFSAIKSK